MLRQSFLVEQVKKITLLRLSSPQTRLINFWPFYSQNVVCLNGNFSSYVFIRPHVFLGNILLQRFFENSISLLNCVVALCRVRRDQGSGKPCAEK